MNQLFTIRTFIIFFSIDQNLLPKKSFILSQFSGKILSLLYNLVALHYT